MAGVFSLLRRVYLSVYNWAVLFGWTQVLFLAVKTIREDGYEHVYGAVERPLLLAQSAAILEIIHSLVGLVRSPISATLPQILSRLFLAWGVLYSYPEVRTHILVSSLVLSWSITEVSALFVSYWLNHSCGDQSISRSHVCSTHFQIIRYSFFGVKEAFGFTPSFLLWLRYSTFLVLYPIGISSEVGLAYLALPYVKASEKFCVRMPNKWNFSFDYYYSCILSILLYIPGSPHMYTYMLGQRKRVLSKSKRE